MNQDIFVVRSALSLRGLPGWCALRSYNKIRHGLRDKNKKALIGLTDEVGQFQTRAGLVLVHDESLVERIITILQCACRGKTRTVDIQEENAARDMRTEFLSLLAENETLMNDDAAFRVTCSQIGISELDGKQLIGDQGNELPQATVTVLKRRV